MKVPTLNIAGWWDQEDFYGPIKIYETLEKHDTKHLNYLVVGPWNHGGWSAPSGESLGEIDFGTPTSADFRKNIEAPWFAYWLKGKGTFEARPRRRRSRAARTNGGRTTAGRRGRASRSEALLRGPITRCRRPRRPTPVGGTRLVRVGPGQSGAVSQRPILPT